MDGHTYYDIFISYSRKDKLVAQCLRRVLERVDFRVWLDSENIQPGTGWRKEIENGVLNGGCVVYLVSPDSVRSNYVQAELAVASRTGIMIIPVLIAGDENIINYPYLTTQFIDARDRQMRSGFTTLIETIYRKFARQLFYRHLHDLVSFLGPIRESHGRAMIYRMHDDEGRLHLHTVYGVYLRDILEAGFHPNEGVVGKAWMSEKSGRVYSLRNWKEEKAKLPEDELNLLAHQKELMENLGMVVAFPLWSKSYVRPTPKKVTKLGVLTIDSTRAMDQLSVGTDGKEFINHGLKIATRLAILLDIEDGHYALGRLELGAKAD